MIPMTSSPITQTPGLGGSRPWQRAPGCGLQRHGGGCQGAQRTG